MTTFLHTADWQIGKPFQSVGDPAKREILRRQRIETVRGLAALVAERGLDFVIVCGDLFDSFTPDKATVSALCAAVGEIGVPVYAIPGNHDHSGPGCVWEQDFFRREQEQLAPNLQVLLSAEPVALDRAVLLPCPQSRRHESTDPTAWLRTLPDDLPDNLPRIILAHGSTRGFSSSGDSDQESAINRIDLEQLPIEAFTYIALGDWHGTKQITEKAWYSGTPEQDRFARGENNLPGRVLIVETTGHSTPPSVQSVSVGRIGWHEIAPVALTNDDDLDTLKGQVETLVGSRTDQDLLKLDIDGTLSFSGAERLEQMIESLEARLIRLKLDQNIQIEPTSEELAALTQSPDPLIAQVADTLQAEAGTDPLARDALRELHLEMRKIEA